MKKVEALLLSVIFSVSAAVGADGVVEGLGEYKSYAEMAKAEKLQTVKFKEKGTVFEYPYDGAYVISALKGGAKISTMRYIYHLSGNKDVKAFIYKKLKGKVYGRSVVDSIFHLVEKGEYDKILKKFTENSIEYRIGSKNDKGVAYSVISYLNRKTSLTKFRKYKKLAFKNLKNKLLYYYIFSRMAYLQEDFGTAHDYLMFVYSFDPYLGADEEIVDIGYKGGKKALSNKEHRDAWVVAADGARHINSLDYNRHIEERLGIKSTLLLSSKLLLNELKTNTQKLYIIDETKKLIELNEEKKDDSGKDDSVAGK